MKHRKKIDDLYRERLQNVETPPPADSWEFIRGHLPREKKKRVLPLWYKMAGAAAVLLLLATLFNLNTFTPGQQETGPVTDRPVEQVPNDPGTATAFEEEEKDTSPASESASESSTNTAVTTAPEAISKTATPEDSVGTTRASEIATTEKEVNNEATSNANAAATAALIFEQEEQQTVVAKLENSETVLNETPENQEKPSPAEALAESAPVKADDLNRWNATQQISAEEELAETIAARESFLKRFRISTTAAAVYFDNLGGGNTLDSQLPESGGGEVSMSYGVNLAYSLSDKLKVRSGINKVNLNYSVPNVNYASAMSSEAINQDPAAFGTILSSARGSIAQELGFIEVPLEMEYALIDKKIGLNIIAGASTLFLENNSLSMDAAGYTTNLGGAQNLNTVSFSANLGLGLHYNLSSRFRLNLEPIFKYQLNTFNDVSGLNPYYFGIYSGLSFGF